MYQYCFSLLAAACVLGLSAQEKNVPEKTFETPLYQAKLSKLHALIILNEALQKKEM